MLKWSGHPQGRLETQPLNGAMKGYMFKESGKWGGDEGKV